MSNDDILAVEYDKEGRPFTVWTRGACYDVEHSKAHGSFYYDSGSGLGDGKLTVGGDEIRIWASPQIIVVDQAGNPVAALPEMVPAVDEDGAGIVTMSDLARVLGMDEEYGAVYCKICDDYMPTSGEDECRHIFWSVDWGDYGGCGACDSDSSYEKSKEDLFDFIDEYDIPLDFIIAALDSGKIDAGLFREYCHDNYEYHDGYGWLRSLEPGKTDEDIRRTVDWLREKTNQ